MVRRRAHALVVGSVLLAAGVVLVAVVAPDPTGSPLQPVDDRWWRLVEEHRTAWAVRVAEVLAVLGSVWVTLPVRVVLAVVLALRRRWTQLGAFAGAVVSAELCVAPLKAVIGRPRPPGALVDAVLASFPSGHAITGAVTAFGLVVVVMAPGPRRPLWIGVAAAFAGMMALSRTYLAVHWLSDVLAGVCLGTGFALVWPAGLELVRDRRAARALAARHDAVPG